MKRRNLFGLLATIPFIGFSSAKAAPPLTTASKVRKGVEFIYWNYIGVFESGISDKCLAEVMVNEKYVHRPDVIALSCTRLLQECAHDKIEVKCPRFKFSKTSFVG